MDLNIDKDWFAQKSAQEGDLEVGVGTRRTMTLCLNEEELTMLERLANPAAAAQRERNAELEKTIEHWRQEVGKLHSKLSGRDDLLHECQARIRAIRQDLASNLSPLPESLDALEARLTAALRA